VAVPNAEKHDRCDVNFGKCSYGIRHGFLLVLLVDEINKDTIKYDRCLYCTIADEVNFAD
jgi:hypothetical protein